MINFLFFLIFLISFTTSYAILNLGLQILIILIILKLKNVKTSLNNVGIIQRLMFNLTQKLST